LPYPRTDIILLKHPKNFLSAAEGLTQLVLLFINTPRYFTVSMYGTGAPFNCTTKSEGEHPPKTVVRLFEELINISRT